MGSARFKSYWTGEDKRLRSTSLEFRKEKWDGKVNTHVLGIELALNATRPHEISKEVSANKEGIRVKHEGLVLSSNGEERKNRNKNGGGCANLEDSCRHCIREEEISFELISRPLTDKAKQMDVENHQCMEGLVTNVIMSAWCLPHRPFGFMPLATLQIGHNPISPEQGHNLAAHL